MDSERLLALAEAAFNGQGEAIAGRLRDRQQRGGKGDGSVDGDYTLTALLALALV
jgi:hypothetical protein